MYTGRWARVAVITVLCCCCLMDPSHGELNGLHSRILEMLKLQQSLDTFQRERRNDVDLREHRLFTSNPKLDSCPTITELSQRAVGINPQGLLLELFNTRNFTQTFYETMCHPAIKDRPCQFIDRKYSASSRCVQEYSYVYALGRTYGNWYEQFRIDYIRIATGCKCQLTQNVMSDYTSKVRYMNEI